MEKVEYEDAKKAKETLIRWLEQEGSLDYGITDNEKNRNPERLLYLALKQDLTVI